MRSIEPVIFVTVLHMVYEDLCWEEDLAELALHGGRVLEHPLVLLDSTYLLL